MDMETSADLSPTEWHEKFIEISTKELLKKIGDYSYDYYYDEHGYNRSKREGQYDFRMIRMAPLFASQPRLKKICQNWKNELLLSSFTTYKFKKYRNNSIDKLYENADDLEYLMKLCGTRLTYLDLMQYPISQIMPIINANCPNLEKLYLGFKEIMSQDFENVFSNMSHLTTLSIKWQCKNSTLPMTLAKSLEQIGGTLKILNLSSPLAPLDIFSPDSLASVFPRLTALNGLSVWGFALSQLLLQSIGKIENLTDLRLVSHWWKEHPMFDTKISMYPIGNLKNLEKLQIACDYGVRDEFLINLCNNAKKLTFLHIIGTDITDIGMSAIDNLQELEDFNLGFTNHGPHSEKNEYITDESIQRLFNKKLNYLNISNCINVTDEGLFKLVENLPNLKILNIQMTKVTSEAIRKIYKFKKLHIDCDYLEEIY
ncbi:uncharacterized protein LOC122856458 [Aphidius gifuensis]|uniref:uncharacterized protein LOC122856458 n=1 Tax=Aphidius gifuensis TaxID=684658 RepID=UPI001CDC89B1|nr:uncharacterized protein LOC122856458 [Aphidius gifuensis]